LKGILFLIFSTNFALLGLIPDWLESWVNYPGLELWKFVNLLIFIVCALYLHRRFGQPIREALRSRSEGIRRELERARDERDQALAKLAEVESRFAHLDAEVARLNERARVEAEAERQRITAATEAEIAKVREQAKREIESAGKAARHELRKFAAEESVRLAEEILAREIGPDDDARITSLNVQELGRTHV
jgi:F0F1-type ATP synthase membrane subunit b/b'